MTRACLFGENPITMLEEEYAIEPTSRALVVVTKTKKNPRREASGRRR